MDADTIWPLYEPCAPRFPEELPVCVFSVARFHAYVLSSPGQIGSASMARAFDENGLRDFTAAGEGSPPPVFVGREGIVSDILAAAERASRPGESRHGEPKITRVVQGAPGSGKSSVLAEIRSRCRSAPRALILNSADITDAAFVLQRLAETVNSADAGGGANWDRSLESPTAEPTLAAFARWADGWNSPGGARERKWDFPLIVAVDEAQRLPPGPHSPVARFIQSIHDASVGLPMTLVLAGLGDTPDVAEKMGLKRGLTPRSPPPAKAGRGISTSRCRPSGPLRLRPGATLLA